jgi:hypothetical protein
MMTATKAVSEVAPKSIQKEWRRPELRKLRIAATATAKDVGNEGVGNPKSGDAHNIS